MSTAETGFKLGLSGCSGALEAMSTSRLLALAPLVESLGFEALWLNEEHFQGGQEFGRLCLSPIPLASAMLARTSRLRVGFSVLLLSLHHPIRLAEELATLDVLSDGRVDFGVSRGSQPRYAEAFGVAGAGAPLADGLAPLLEAWSERQISFAGAAVSVQPKPVQKPHPPIYVATYTPETARWAGAAGYRLICHGITSPEVNTSLMTAFADGGGDTAAVPFGRFVYVSDSDEAARREVWPTILAQTDRLKRIGIHKRGTIVAEALLEPEVFLREMVVVGSPATCAEQIRDLSARYGTRYFNGLAGFFGYLPFDQMLRSITLLGDEVRPLLDR
jgi:alkanesulfonate monooxygenase SsuD/methylene tetrahydromethanopterin reductase-like flavin-dependent oxidoreductase (luciferase family)